MDQIVRKGDWSMNKIVSGLTLFCWVMGSDVMGSARTMSTNTMFASSRYQNSNSALRTLNGWWKDAVRANQLTQKMVIRPEDPRVYAEISQNAYELLGFDKNRLFGQPYDNAQASLIRKYRQEILKWHSDKWASASQKDQEYAASMSKSLNAAKDLINRELESSHSGSPYVLQGRTVEQEEAERAWEQEQEHQRREQEELYSEQQQKEAENQKEFDRIFAQFYEEAGR